MAAACAYVSIRRRQCVALDRLAISTQLDRLLLSKRSVVRGKVSSSSNFYTASVFKALPPAFRSDTVAVMWLPGDERVLTVFHPF